jgi:ATP-dependent DNA helicase RecG
MNSEKAVYMDIRKLWVQLQKSEETNTLEVKPGTDAGPALMQTISAYSNTIGLGGGYILLGISESKNKKDKFYISGVKNPEKLQNDIVSQCGSVFNVPVHPEIGTEIIDGNVVIGLYIPEAESAQKPVYIKRQGLEKGTYIRLGAADVKCTNYDLSRLYQDKTQLSFDSMCLKDLTLEDLDPSAINEYRRLRSLVDPSASELKLGDAELLLALKCVVKDKKILRPNTAGLFLFGKSDALKREFPMRRFDYIRMPGTKWESGMNKAYYSVELHSALFSLLPRAESVIMDDIPRIIIPPSKGLLRDEYPIVPVLVIREALVNTVMHRDYQVASPTQVIRYSDRIEFRNAGYSLKPHPESGMPGSNLRNLLIADILHETKYAENKGTGILTMIEEMRKANLSLPEFKSDRDGNNFIATIYMHNLADAESLKWLTQFKEFNLTNNSTRILMLLHTQGTIRNCDCRKLLGTDVLSASAELKHLRNIGLIKKCGGGAKTYYILENIRNSRI